jgi:enoyl-CoA hydratase/carnithine racemase
MTTVRAEDRGDGVRLLTLDRPPANAITAGLLTDLSAALDAARDDAAVRAVVLTGEGRFFSAGLDLRGGIDFQAATAPGPAVDPFGALRTCLTTFLRFSKPTIAMLRGHAIAGGLILVLACDYRLGLDGDYRIGLNEVEIGASFPRAAFEIVRLRLTHQQATELLLGAAIYPASQATRLGVVDELLPGDKLERTVFRRAARLGSFPRDAYAHTKAALVAETIASIEAEAPDEALRTAAVWMSAESVAARAAQQQKLTKDSK